ncbi:MAG: hypothetical protein EA379_12350 [Phycisphaerales bacterium]|nr:MAG: hypothetical protein EA379_12350 [Phycisphaerales bacterium]
MCLLGALPARAGAAVATLDDFAWLAGSWMNESERTTTEEHWTDVRGGTMLGMFRLTVAGTARMHELILLEQDGDDVVMRLRHFGAGMRAWEDAPIVFRLTEAAAGVYLFTQEDAPTTLEYRRTDEGSLVVTLSKQNDEGAVQRTRFEMRRAE